MKELEQTNQTLPDKKRTVEITLDTQRNRQSEIHEPSDIHQMKELLPEVLLQEYKRIDMAMQSHTQITDTQPERLYIDIENIYTQEIEQWIENVKKHLKETDPECTNEALQAFEASSWMLFQASADVYNTTSMEQEIFERINQTNYYDLGPRGQEDIRKEIAKKITERFPFHQREVELLIKTLHKSRKDDFGIVEVAKTVRNIYTVFELHRHKKSLAIMGGGRILNSILTSVQPYLWEGVYKNNRAHFEVFLQYWLLQQGTDLLKTKLQLQFADIGAEIKHSVKSIFTQALFYKDLAGSDAVSYGEMEQVMNEGMGAMGALLEDVTSIAPTTVTLATSLAFMTALHPAIGIFGMTAIPITVYINNKMSNRMRVFNDKGRQAGVDASTVLTSMKYGSETLRGSGNVPSAVSHANELEGKTIRLGLEKDKFWTKGNILRDLPSDIANLLAFAMGAYLQSKGLVSMGAIVSTTDYTNRLQWKVQNLLNTYFNSIPKNMAEIKRFEEIVGKITEVDKPDGELEKTRTAVDNLPNLNISFEDISFSIIDKKTHQEKEILNGIDLYISEGSFITIVGESGSGKTTLLRLLGGMYQPTNGEITLGEEPLSTIRKYGDYSLQSIRVISNQAPHIFEGLSLRENLLLWDSPEGREEDIIEILKQVNLTKFISQLDNKELQKFSGGETVRIGFARALLRLKKLDTKKGLLLLDEPTAGLDKSSRHIVHTVLKDIRKNNPEITIICVTHDEQIAYGDDRNTIEIENGQIKTS